MLRATQARNLSGRPATSVVSRREKQCLGQNSATSELPLHQKSSEGTPFFARISDQDLVVLDSGISRLVQTRLLQGKMCEIILKSLDLISYVVLTLLQSHVLYANNKNCFWRHGSAGCATSRSLNDSRATFKQCI